jgi:glycosyltransferase involved in cell wall biosynthesis
MGMGSVFISAGRYYLDSLIQAVTNITIYGEGITSTVMVWNGATNGTMFLCYDKSVVTLKSMGFVCNYLANVALNFTRSTPNTFIHNLIDIDIYHPYLYGIYIYGSDHDTFQRVTVTLSGSSDESSFAIKIDACTNILLDMWPSIKRNIPDASLVVTSDYRLWGAQNPRNNERYIQQAMMLEDVDFLSAVPRSRLIEEQLKAEINLYPCTYVELFCIAVAESQVAGVYPVTSGFGALMTTNMIGTILKVNPNDGYAKREFTKEAIFILQQLHEREINMVEKQEEATERFHPKRILQEWNEKIFNG